MELTSILTAIFLLIYTAACTSHAIAQVGLAGEKKAWVSSDKSFSFLSNSVTIGIFILLYIKDLITFPDWFFSFIITHHTLRSVYNFKSYPDNIREWTMPEIYINMVLFISTVFGMIICTL